MRKMLNGSTWEGELSLLLNERNGDRYIRYGFEMKDTKALPSDIIFVEPSVYQLESLNFSTYGCE